MTTESLRYGPLAPVLRLALLLLPLAVLALACATAPIEALKATATPAATQAVIMRPMRVIITATPAPMCAATGNVNVRAGAGTEHAVVAWLAPGQVVEVVAAGEWLQIAGPDGYIWAALCEEVTK